MRLSLDVSGYEAKKTTPLPFLGMSPKGETLSANSGYFEKNGKPWFPVMGEFHFSRFPCNRWEEELLKMKAGGINVVATYVFWIHHEEIEGQWDWSGNKDLRRFVTLCGRHGLSLLLRIGPWAHGECRNGGFPDWLMKKPFPLRENNDGYFYCVRGFYHNIYKQVDGLLFSQGGPIIGVQLENEYGHVGGLSGEAGKEHLRTLKRIAVEEGFAVPFYTATAWGGGIVVDDEMLPVLGGYVEAPWTQHTKELPANVNYLIEPFLNDTAIASDFREVDDDGFTCDIARYPFSTAELGGGLMPTHHRRVKVTGDDTQAMILAKLASGVNLVGYYMYHGGTNPMGRRSSLEESRQTGGNNDYPKLSYDFQAPLGEFGQANDAYHTCKLLHFFLKEFGGALTAMETVIPPVNSKDAEDMDTPRLSIQTDGKSGFLFLNNYQRKRVMTQKVLSIALQTKIGPVTFPDLTLSNGCRAILPFGLSLDGVFLSWATAQPIGRTVVDDTPEYLFFTPQGIPGQFALKGVTVAALENGMQDKTGDLLVLSVSDPKKAMAVTLKGKSGIVRLRCLPYEAALSLFLLSNGQAIFFPGLVIDDGETAALFSRTALTAVCTPHALPPQVKTDGVQVTCQGTDSFTGYYRHSLALTPVETQLCLEEIPCTKENVRTWKVAISCEPKGIHDLFLQLHWAGSEARLYLDDTLAADTYYIDGVWDIGLSRFDIKGDTDVRLEITAYREGDDIFFDCPPKLENGVACRIEQAQLSPEYQIDLSLMSL